MAATLEQFMQAMQQQQAAQQQLLQQQQQQQPLGAPPTQQSASERPLLNARSFDNIDVRRRRRNLATWSWEIKTAASGMHGVLADVMTASETGEDRTVLNDVDFVDEDQAQCTKTSLLARHTRS